MNNAHYLLADMLLELMNKGYYRNTTSEGFKGNVYEPSKHEFKSFRLNQEIVITDLSIYDDISSSAIKMLIQIQKELKLNNPLWECTDKSLTTTRQALKQLKDKQILTPFPGSNTIYIVNPEKIRRGKPLACLAALYVYCKQQYSINKRWQITSKLAIKDFNAPNESIIVDRQIGI